MAKSKNLARLSAFAACVVLWSGSTSAETARIQIDGVKSISVVTRAAPKGFITAPGAQAVTKSRIAPPVEVGAVMPKKHTMLLNTARLGLPAPQDGWVYFKVYRDIYRVDMRSREVLERVTHLANGAF